MGSTRIDKKLDYVLIPNMDFVVVAQPTYL